MSTRLDGLERRELPGGLVLLVAGTRVARGRGLAHMDAEGLDDGQALLFPRCRSLHTAGMRFALDLVWLDAAGGPVRVDDAVAPRRLRTCLRARAVVECHAGRGQDFARALAAAPQSPTARIPES